MGLLIILAVIAVALYVVFGPRNAFTAFVSNHIGKIAAVGFIFILPVLLVTLWIVLAMYT